jgi:endogenous inhibitor of DNA gyrase (YacG/DUF329 family)
MILGDKMAKCIICGKNMKSNSLVRKYCYECRNNVALKNWIKTSVERRKTKKNN